MSQPILLVDFDRTLFDTDRFTTACWQAITKKYKVDGQAELANVASHYTEISGLKYYNFQSHIAAVLSVPPWKVTEAIRPALKTQNFVYDDAKLLFRWQRKYPVRILTFGATWHQQYKLSFAPQFKDIPVDITLQPKGKFIAEKFKGSTGWLIDDKYNGGLPDGFTEIHLVRTAQTPIEKNDGKITVNSLKSVQEVL